jgi:hypothetical protein
VCFVLCLCFFFLDDGNHSFDVLLGRSQFRDVPDNQEVFADADSDRSIQIELAEPIPNLANSDAAPRYFSALASDAGALSHTLESTSSIALPRFGHQCFQATAQGVMQICKGRDAADAANTVRVVMIVARLASVDTDVLVTLNLPIAISPNSQSARDVRRIASAKENAALIEQVMQSLTLKSLDIFNV